MEMEMIEAFRESYRGRYRLLRCLRREGRGLVGWVCTYVPEEIIEAAGLHPFRILGGKEGDTAQADAYLYTNNCSFVRNCLEEGLRAELPPLDGLVTCNTCDQIRRLYDVWARYLPPPFHRQLCLPCHFGPSALDYFHRELVRFQEALEGHFHLKITQESLRGSIRRYNRMRRLLRRLYELRKQEHPPIRGSQVMEVIRAGMVLEKREYVPMLEGLLSELESDGGAGDRRDSGDGPRLLLLGSELDGPDYVRVIEEMGARVVADDLCTGSRYFWELVDEEGDPLECLARKTLRVYPRVKIMGMPSYLWAQEVGRMAREYRCDSFIFFASFTCKQTCGFWRVMTDAVRQATAIPPSLVTIDACDPGIASERQIKEQIRQYFQLLESRP